MKLILIFIITIMFVLTLATLSQAVVSGTVHDFSNSGANPLSFIYGTNESQVCIFCHTPHGGSLTGPLWNRKDVVGAFTFYSSNTTSATVNAVTTVSPESMLCLSCHDGTIAVNSMLNYSSIGKPEGPTPGDITIGYISGGNNKAIGSTQSTKGGQLADDHPISFSYNAVLADYSAALKTGLKSIGLGMPSEIRFFGVSNRVECSSCHNPHEAGIAPFLVMSNTGSALCLGCHDK